MAGDKSTTAESLRGTTAESLLGTTADSLLGVTADTLLGTSADELLAQGQHDKLHEYLPVIVCMGLISVIGTFGNIMTIKFYGSQRKRTSTVNLITALSVLDLIVCGLLYTTIADLCVNITYTNAILCKLMYFCDHFIVVSSVLVLAVISIDRYRKICKPFGKQLSIRASVFTVFAMVGASFVMSVRDFVTYDVVKVNVSVTSQHNETIVTGYYCTNTDDPDLQVYVILFHVFDVMFISSVLITFIFTYGHIWRELKKMKKKNLAGNSPRYTKRPVSDSSSRTPPSFDSVLDDSLPDEKKTAKRVETLPMTNIRSKMQQLTASVSNPNFLQVPVSKEQRMTTSVSNSNVLQVPGSKESRMTKSVSNPNLRQILGKNTQIILTDDESSTSFNIASGNPVEGKRKNKRKTKLMRALTSRTENNITVMMLAVSVGFAICFTPYFFVSVGIRIFTTTGEFELNAGVQFALRSPFWNSVINPIIFCVFNPQYRRYIVKTLCRQDGIEADVSTSSK